MSPVPSIPLKSAQERWQAGLPVLSAESLSISQSQLYDALVALRPLLSEDGDAHEALDRLLASDYVDTARSDFLLFDVWESDRIRKMAVSLPAAPDVLALLLHTVMTPIYQGQAAAYRPWIETAELAAWILSAVRFRAQDGPADSRGRPADFGLFYVSQRVVL